MTRSRPTVLSVFSGAGGLDLGLECARFRTVAAIELDAIARKTIVANRPKWNLLETPDVVEIARELRPRELGLKKRELGMLVGGPPCQPFSKAAQWAPRGRRGLLDPRSKCLDAFLCLLETFLPRVMLIENVAGFVVGKTSALKLLETALEAINSRNGTKYKLEWKVLNAVDYGVAQRRSRAILVARRDGKALVWPGKTHKKPLRAADVLRDVKPSAVPSASGYWAGLLPSIPEGQNYLFHTRDGGGLPIFGRRRWFWSFLLKLSKEEPAWTIPAKPGPSTGPFHWDNRPLAIEELLRIQSFPSTWRVAGSHVAQVRQIGNATPPLLAEVIGRAIGEQVFGLQYASPPILKIKRLRALPAKSRRKSVPEKYRKHLNSQTDHPGEGLGPGALARQRSVDGASRRAKRAA